MLDNVNRFLEQKRNSKLVELAKLAKEINETAQKNKINKPNLSSEDLPPESIEDYRNYMRSFGYGD